MNVLQEILPGKDPGGQENSADASVSAVLASGKAQAGAQHSHL